MSIETRLQRLLGLGDNIDIIEICVLEPPPSPAAEGFVRSDVSGPDGSASGLSASLIERILLDSAFTTDDTADKKLPAARVRRWDRDACIIAIEPRAAVETVAGAVEQVEGFWLLDSRSDGGAMHLSDQGAEYVLSGQDDRLTIVRLQRAHSEDQWTFEPPADVGEITPPALSTLVEGLELPLVISKRYEQLARAPSALARVAAVGSIARLAAATTSDPVSLAQQLLAGEEGPAARAVAWARTLDEQQISLVEREAIEEAGRLGDELATVDQLLERVTTEELAMVTRSLWHRRDALESAATMLGVCRPRDELRGALERVDFRGAVAVGVLDVIGGFSDPLLSIVAIQEPAAWWGIL
jgi:hypothetical protein